MAKRIKKPPRNPHRHSQKEPEVHLEVTEQPMGGRVATLTFDHPRRLNVLGSKMLERSAKALEEASNVEDLRVLVVTGAGGHAFIGGADIHEFGALDKGSAREFITKIHHLCRAIRAVPVPVIARIQGYCLGAGMEVAAACDMRVATEVSIFGMPEVAVGVPSVIEAALLPALIGWGKTRELLLTGEVIEAEEALRYGFLERMVKTDHLELQVKHWVDAIVGAGPSAVRLQKALIGEWEHLSIENAIERGIDYFEKAYETDEPRRYAQKFFDRNR